VSNTDSGDQSLNKNQRRDAAREQARLLREAQKKKERRRRWILQGSIVAAVLAVVVIVVVVITNSVKPVGPGPANMASDGIVIGEGLIAQRSAARPIDAEPIPSAGAGTSDAVEIIIYQDYFCPFCGAFEDANGDQIRTWVETGVATIEIHPVAILDNASLGTKYSTRSANAAACVANYAPDDFFAFNAELFANQPAERTEGLSDAVLKELVGEADVSSAAQINPCIDDQTFAPWVTAATTRAGAVDADGNLKIVPITDPPTERFGTPTILVNGVQYTGSVEDAAEFATFVLQQSGVEPETDPTESPAP
jgi:protein-disulfide isomerase